MPRDINQRLSALRARRSGTDRMSAVAMDAREELLAKSFVTESYHARAKSKSYTEYALGAMQEVDADSTRISLNTAERVGKQLEAHLGNAGIPVLFELQGSVPLNVHIRGVSDVDLLTLSGDFLTYDPSGPAEYSSVPTPKTSVTVLSTIRAEAEKALRLKYPAATVDTTGSKAVKISGGTLARPVDVVPSHWHDTAAYQRSKQKSDRVVTIFDNKKVTTLDNYPFKHIALVTERDGRVYGSLKKAIRLCKNVRSDADSDIKLSSFDIASLMYHADQPALTLGCFYELSILAETQRFLDSLWRNQAYAKTLRAPDGSRCILDSEDKMTGLLHLSNEMDDLLKQVAKEQNSLLKLQGDPSLGDSREALRALKVV